MHVCIHACGILACLLACVLACECVCVCVNVCMCVWAWVWVWVCVGVCMLACVCVFAFGHFFMYLLSVVSEAFVGPEIQFGPKPIMSLFLMLWADPLCVWLC
jgi:hypothetical protein